MSAQLGILQTSILDMCFNNNLIINEAVHSHMLRMLGNSEKTWEEHIGTRCRRALISQSRALENNEVGFSLEYSIHRLSPTRANVHVKTIWHFCPISTEKEGGRNTERADRVECHWHGKHTHIDAQNITTTSSSILHTHHESSNSYFESGPSPVQMPFFIAITQEQDELYWPNKMLIAYMPCSWVATHWLKECSWLCIFNTCLLITAE